MKTEKKFDNRKAKFEYELQTSFTAGMILSGWMVKPLINGDFSFIDSYAFVKNGEVYLHGLNITKTKHTFDFDALKKSNDTIKLLLNKSEINKIAIAVKVNGITLIPVSIIYGASTNNKLKIVIAIAKGKKLFDKSKAIKSRDLSRESNREIKHTKRST